MSDPVQAESGVLGEEGKPSLVSYPVADSNERTCLDIGVGRRDREAVGADKRHLVMTGKKQPLARQVVSQLSTFRDEARIAIRSRGRIVLLNPRDIVTVVAQGNYVLLRRHADSHLVREKISTIAEKLKCYGFIQIHRSVLVNRLYVEEIRGVPTGEYVLRIKSGKEYTVTRTYKKMLTDLAEVWIGTESFTTEL